MVCLKKAHDELFRRSADETFETLDQLRQHCRQQKGESADFWQRPQLLGPQASGDSIWLALEGGRKARLNDWSFSQTCRLAGVSKETVNRLSLETASRVLQETLPTASQPMQVLSTGDEVRAIHGPMYTRLWNIDLLNLVSEFATDFQPPQVGVNGGTGLYCGEQDMFCFLIDPLGWTEIGDQAFAPGFFVWNSEVGRRSIGIQTFWFQAVCQNHIVWDAVEVAEFTRKHTTNVGESLAEIRRHIEMLVSRRDERRDAFVKTIGNAMQQVLGDETAKVIEKLREIPKFDLRESLLTEALASARHQGRLTVFSIVDALTKLSQRVRYAGDRLELDRQAARLLTMAG